MEIIEIKTDNNMDEDFAKAFMQEFNIPTASYKSFNANQYEQAIQFLHTLKPPYVLKADGLAAGKGVIISSSITLTLMFAILLIILYLFIVLHVLRMSFRVKSEFHSLILAGLAASLGIQVFLTIGGGSRLIPLTGVTLPLISMGGSSLSAIILSFAVMHGIYVKEFVNCGILTKDSEETFAEEQSDVIYEKELSEETFESADETEHAEQVWMKELTAEENNVVRKEKGYFEEDEFQGDFRKNW